MTARNWYYAADQSPTGPFSAAAIRDLLEAGVISPDTFVWAHGRAEWTPLHAVEDFGTQVAQVPPPVPESERGATRLRRAREDESAARTMYVASCTTFAILFSLALYGLFQDGTASGGVYASHVVEGGQAIQLGETVTGHLGETDALLDDSTRYDNWLYEGTAGELIDVRLKSEAFDSYLFIRPIQPEQASVLGDDDDSGNGTNAYLQVKLPQSGTYAIVVNSFMPSEGGAYTLTLSTSKGDQNEAP